MTSKVDPRTEKAKYVYWPYTHNTGIQTFDESLYLVI